jgi:AcrR family transcriptional regulator
MNLRERQKEKRHIAIIKAALSLIKKKGYAATSIEEIAAKAEVGVGTVYNYFHTKADIVVELYIGDAAGNLREGQKILAVPWNKYEQTIIDLLIAYATGYYGKREKSLLREIFAIAMSEQALAREKLLQADYTLIDQIAGVLKEAYKRQEIKPSVVPEEAGSALFSLAMYDFMIFVTDENMTFKELKGLIHRHIQFIFEGISLTRS